MSYRSKSTENGSAQGGGEGRSGFDPGASVDPREFRAGVDRFEADIDQAIASELAPRLMLAHRVRAPSLSGRPLGTAGAVSRADIDIFVELVLEDEPGVCGAFIEQLIQRGVSRVDILTGLLAATARRLGDMWDRDERGLVEVTLGLCRLHRELRERDWSGGRDLRPATDAPKVLLATLCGDQHIFGLVIVGEMFRQAGWRVATEGAATAAALAARLADEEIDVVGLSASCDIDAADAARDIKRLRAASKNPDLKIFVGGRIFIENQSLVSETGADGLATDAKSAPALAAKLVEVDVERC